MQGWFIRTNVHSSARAGAEWQRPSQCMSADGDGLFKCVICPCVCVLSESCPTLCDPVDCSPPGSSVHGTFPARVLQWGAVSFRGSSQPRDLTPCLLHWQVGFLPLCHLGSPLYAHSEILLDQKQERNFDPHHSRQTLKKLGEVSVSQSGLTPCDPVDCSPPGSSVHGIFQARILGWVAISFSRGASQPRNWTCISCVFCIADRLFTRWAIRGVSQIQKDK